MIRLKNVKIKFLFIIFLGFLTKNVVCPFEGCVSPPLACPNENITFWLYTRDTQESPSQLNVSNSESFDSAPFVPNVPMIFLIHGYTGWKDYAPNPEIRPFYFENGEYNVISVDYNPLVREPCYPAAAGNVPLIGMCVAQMIDYLVEERNIPLDNFHIVGFSLGAQVSGELSNWLKSGRLPRITGLDPALPLFVSFDNTKKLDKSDAEFVDVIHTNALRRGKLETCGHVDFYVNGGLNQPGCEDSRNNNNMTEGSCSHWRAPVYYGESINSNVGFYGKRCPSWIKYMLGLCNINNSTEEVIMGEYTPTTAEGIYFVEVNSQPPHARGKNSNIPERNDEKTRKTLSNENSSNSEEGGNKTDIEREQESEEVDIFDNSTSQSSEN